MKKKQRRKRKILLVLYLFFFLYITWIEPNMLTTDTVTLPVSPATSSITNLKIIQFSDTHVKNTKNQKYLMKVIDQINAADADLVFFTGDLIDDPSQFDYEPELIQNLSKIQAKIGKFSIYGNHDHGGYGTESYAEIMKQSGFTLLQNESVKLSVDDVQLTIVGLDDMILGKPDRNLLAPKAGRTQDYQILLAHEPDFADQLQSDGYDLMLTGHSHGGQIQLPFLQAMIRPFGAKVYTEGVYDLENVQTKLYVNTGIGTTRVPFRFLVPPEITEIRFEVRKF